MKTYKEIAEALKGKQHKIDKNKNGQIDAQDFKILRKEEVEELDEGVDPSEVAGNPKMYDAATVKKAYYHKSATPQDKKTLERHLDRHHGMNNWRKPVKEETIAEATVKTQKYSWGTMKTVHHGADFSIPLHPEHHQAIAKLKDEQEHKFKDETGRHWTARRKGEDVHFHSANDGPKTTVKHADLKEEVEDEERMSRSDYKVSPSGRKSHKEIVFKHGEEDKKASIQEVSPPGFEGTVKAMKKHKEIDNPYALAWYMKNKGMKSHKKADGTMKEDHVEEGVTGAVAGGIAGGLAGGPLGALAGAYLGHKIQQGANSAKKLAKEKEKLRREEVEQIDEKSEQAKRNKTMKNMLDAARGARYKASGNPVPDREPQHKTPQAHNKAIGRALRNEELDEAEQATGGLKDACWKGYTAVGMKMKNGKKVPNCVPVNEHAEMSAAREYQYISEGMRTTHEDPLVTVHDKDGLHTHANLSTANGIFGTKVKHTAVHAGPVKVKDGHETKRDLTFAISQHHAQAVKDEEKFRKQFGEETKQEDPPFDGPYTKVKADAKDKSGATHTPMSRAKHLARMAMKKQMKEDIDRLFEKDDSEYNYEGEMAVTQLKTIMRHAEALQAKMQPDTNLPEWVQSKITLAADYIQTASDYLHSEIEEQAPVAPVPGQKWNSHAVMVNGKQRVVIPRKNVKNYPDHEGWREVSPGQKLKEDDEVQFSYKEFAMMLEYETKDGVYRHKGTYGGNYVDPEGADDADDKKPKQQPAEKRGRGRPAGAKSGARKITGTSKLYK